MSITFDLYFNKIMLLCDTMVVKHDYLAQIINQGIVVATGGRIAISETDRRSWKYYMNLAGEYHQYDKERLLKLTDGKHEHMRIKIAGDYEPIEVDFTKALISGPDADPATRNEYKYGSQYYRELVARYPDFEELILGILNPIEPEVSIPAKNGEILLCGEYYRTRSELNPSIFHYQRTQESIFNNVELIEEQEINLIAKLQNFCYTYLDRWCNYDYIEADDLYFQTVWSILFAGMPMAVINARLAANKTNQAHTYHIRELLNSHGYLGRHVDHLNIDVILWLYRNIEYLDAGMGMQETFDLILDNVFTKSGIPIKSFVLAQDSRNASQGQLPVLTGYERPLNMDNAGVVLDRRLTINDLLEKEKELARDNEKVQAEDEAYILFEGARSSSDYFNTKLLESTVIDYSNFIPYRIEDVLMNMWAYSIAKSSYRGIAYVTHPSTGDRLQFTMLNAFILMIYCFNKAHSGLELPTVPNVYVSMIPREDTSPHPDFAVKLDYNQFRSLVPSPAITESEIRKIMGTRQFRSSFNSSVDFYGEVEEVWKELCRVYDYADNCQWIDKSCYRHVVARNKFWWGMELPLPLSGMSYEQWFTLQNLDISMLSSEELLKLCTELFMYGTGYVENHARKLKEIQRACISVLQHFASYSVHLVADNSTYAPLMSRDGQLKMDHLEFSSELAIAIDEPHMDTHAQYAVSTEYEIKHTDTFSSEHINIHVSAKIEIDVDVPAGRESSIDMNLYIPVDPVVIEVLEITDL